MPRNNLLIALLGSLSLSIFGAGLVSAEAESERAWVLIKPLQCLDNPWEKDWLQKNKPATNYPHAREKMILKDYFKEKGIQVWDVRQKPFIVGADHTCKACGCERGDTLLLSINASSAENMRLLGYDRVMPAYLVEPPKKKK